MSRPFPRRIGAVEVPQDAISRAAWIRAERSLPEYLFSHSVRSYCWGIALAAHDGLELDREIFWVAALLHDVGLTRIGRSGECFELDGAGVARQFALGAGMTATAADRVARAIVLHMASQVTPADGAEGYELDRATGIDVRGRNAELVAGMRGPVDAAYPRGAFDRLFKAAVAREVAIRTDCQSARLLAALG